MFKKNDDSSKKRKVGVEILRILRIFLENVTPAMMHEVVNVFGRDPFLILVGCLLSLRTKDAVTIDACKRLFARIITPKGLLELPIQEIEKLIYPVGFYRKKAKILVNVSTDIVERFDGTVPCSESELLSIKGVGRKTAALVLGEGFGIPALCVDVHVHRISNRIGLIETEKPYETEVELRKILPKHNWIECNKLLVSFGQNLCVPVSPFCSRCPIAKLCFKKDVKRNR